MSDNTVTIVGNTTRDCELRYTPSGSANLRIGVAVNRRWQKDGEWQEATSFFDVIAWRDLAENAAESLTKGSRIVVTGRLEQRQYEKDGVTRNVVEIIADDIAPSLRWATADVTRTEKKQQGSGRGYAPPADDFGDEPF